MVLLFDNAFTPGRTLPSSSSRLAPPPVLTWLTFSAAPNSSAALAVSPPPIMVADPALVATTTDLKAALVPSENFSNSKTPKGPFQTRVLDLRITSWNNARDLGPTSRPSQPSGIPSWSVTHLLSNED